MNIFDCGGALKSANCAYCVDISGSMYTSLDTVKSHLVEHLSERTGSSTLFNLIAFSTDVYPWSDSMIPAAESGSIERACEWVRQLECKTGTNTLDALVRALEDEKTTAVCLLTDDLCDQQPYVVLNRVSQISRGDFFNFKSI